MTQSASTPDYTDVTEMAGEAISAEQLFRQCNRYYWAGAFVEARDAIEVGCGAGPGLGYLAGLARSLRAGDYSQAMVDRGRAHYGDRLEFIQPLRYLIPMLIPHDKHP